MYLMFRRKSGQGTLKYDMLSSRQKNSKQECTKIAFLSSAHHRHSVDLARSRMRHSKTAIPVMTTDIDRDRTHLLCLTLLLLQHSWAG